MKKKLEWKKEWIMERQLRQVGTETDRMVKRIHAADERIARTLKKVRMDHSCEVAPEPLP